MELLDLCANVILTRNTYMYKFKKSGMGRKARGQVRAVLAIDFVVNAPSGVRAVVGVHI